MGERLLCKQEVIGSNPFTSTSGADFDGLPQVECESPRMLGHMNVPSPAPGNIRTDYGMRPETAAWALCHREWDM